MSAPGNVRKSTTSRDDWRTPQDLFDLIEAQIEDGFTLDAAADANNTKCTKFYSLEDDAFQQTPVGGNIWCNPPYGHLDKWIELFARWTMSENYIIALLPVATETQWFERMWYCAYSINFLVKRVQFLDENGNLPVDARGKRTGNTTGSMVVEFAPRPTRMAHTSPKVQIVNWQQGVDNMKKSANM